jgi:hypothetical protein
LIARVSICDGSGFLFTGLRFTRGLLRGRGHSRQGLFQAFQIRRFREMLIEPGLQRPLHVFGQAVPAQSHKIDAPPLANDRLKILDDGVVRLEFKKPWSDGDGRGEAAWGRGGAGRP